MGAADAKLPLFLDNNIPDSLGRYLQRRGHSVHRLRFYIPADSPDPIVATTAMEAGRILVSQDKDFNGQRFRQDRFARLSRIALSGDAHTLLSALKKHIEIVEFHWGRCLRDDVKMIAHLRIDQIRFET